MWLNNWVNMDQIKLLAKWLLKRSQQYANTTTPGTASMKVNANTFMLKKTADTFNVKTKGVAKDTPKNAGMDTNAEDCLHAFSSMTLPPIHVPLFSPVTVPHSQKHLKLKAEVESLRKENKEKKIDIKDLTSEIKELKMLGDKTEK